MHIVTCESDRALCNEGSVRTSNTAMMAITISISASENPRGACCTGLEFIELIVSGKVKRENKEM